MEISKDQIVDLFNRGNENTKFTLQTMFPSIFALCKRGDFFIHKNKSVYILANYAGLTNFGKGNADESGICGYKNNQICLVSLKDGNVWSNAVTVRDVNCITEEEFQAIIACSDIHDWKKIDLNCTLLYEI